MLQMLLQQCWGQEEMGCRFMEVDRPCIPLSQRPRQFTAMQVQAFKQSWATSPVKYQFKMAGTCRAIYSSSVALSPKTEWHRNQEILVHKTLPCSALLIPFQSLVLSLIEQLQLNKCCTSVEGGYTPVSVSGCWTHGPLSKHQAPRTQSAHP